jgi:hypothetical protein
VTTPRYDARLTIIRRAFATWGAATLIVACSAGGTGEPIGGGSVADAGVDAQASVDASDAGYSCSTGNDFTTADAAHCCGAPTCAAGETCTLFGFECQETFTCVSGQWRSPGVCGGIPPGPPYICTPQSVRCDQGQAEEICGTPDYYGSPFGCLSTDGCTCYTCQPNYAGPDDPEPSPSGFCDGGAFYADASTDAASDEE